MRIKFDVGDFEPISTNAIAWSTLVEVVLLEGPLGESEEFATIRSVVNCLLTLSGVSSDAVKEEEELAQLISEHAHPFLYSIHRARIAEASAAMDVNPVRLPVEFPQPDADN
ncbi:hypothetical protein BIU90_01795 [Curtobacterium sp. MCBA15_001]|nr:hypothetical protein BIU90_01795 [Curtobacterium sp. MCBA15_001]